MRAIKIDGETYINKKDVLEEYIPKEEYEQKIEYAHKDLFMNQEMTMAMGSCKITGDWRKTRINVEYLQKAINSLKNMNDNLDIAISNEYPICLGKIENDSFSGIIIAPLQEV